MASHILKRLGKAIRYYRHERRMTQNQLAYYAKLNRAYIGHVERGEKNITIKNLAKIADALGIDTSALVSGIENPDPRIYFFPTRKRVVRKRRKQPSDS